MCIIKETYKQRKNNKGQSNLATGGIAANWGFRMYGKWHLVALRYMFITSYRIDIFNLFVTP